MLRSLRAIPRSVYALTYLWDLSDRGEITPREAHRGVKLCNRILRSDTMVKRFMFSIDLGNMTAKDFLKVHADMPLAEYELGAIFHALTR